MNADGVKKKIQDSGLSLYGKLIEVEDGESGATKVMIDDAPLDMENHKLIEILSEYGEIREMRNQHLYINGKRTSWLTGTRVVFMRKVHRNIPPSVMTNHNGHNLKISLHHSGQTLVECRFCRAHVERGNHDCRHHHPFLYNYYSP